MLDHPFRTLGMFASLAFAALIGWAVTLGGYKLPDPEIEAEMGWVQALKEDHPELAREIGPQCGREIGRSPWTRDGAMALFRCIRAKAEARGIYYYWDDEEPPAES